jgi:hypothetical protein
MAEPTPAPALPSTADPIPYVPVSWMAVAAIAVASLFVAILLVLGLVAFREKKPLIQPVFLALPAIGVVLSFAARRLIRNSEGTRTGENLANNAWWICLVAGLGYAAYLLAIDFAIRRDARSELERWVENIKTAEETSVNTAFLRTREPGQRSTIRPDDTAQIKGRFRDDYLGFEQCDLVVLAQRNKGACEFTPGAVKEWSTRAGGVDCAYSGVLKCPEGQFPVTVALRGMEPTGTEAAGRQWMVMFNPASGYVARDQMSLTKYGWLMQVLEESGAQFGNQFITGLRNGPWIIPYIYHSMIIVESQPPAGYWVLAAGTASARMAIIGGLGAATPYTSDYLALSFPDQFYRTPGGGSPSAEQRAQFKLVWEAAGVVPTGTRLRNSPDTHSIVRVTESRVEVSVPCELSLPGQDGTSAARGRLIVVSGDPGLIGEIKQLRAEANPDIGTTAPPADLVQRNYKWRIVGLESDMVKIQMQRPGEPGAPPAPPPTP